VVWRKVRVAQEGQLVQPVAHPHVRYGKHSLRNRWKPMILATQILVILAIIFLAGKIVSSICRWALGAVIIVFAIKKAKEMQCGDSTR
jgi:transcriptional regulator of nitric oxide reductase